MIKLNKFCNIVSWLTSRTGYIFDSDDCEVLHQAMTDAVKQDPLPIGKISENELIAFMEALRTPGVIPAIKMYREFTGAGLREAKHAVEKYHTGGPVI